MDPQLPVDLEKLAIKYIKKAPKAVPSYAVENYVISCLENLVNSIRSKELQEKLKK